MNSKGKIKCPNTHVHSRFPVKRYRIMKKTQGNIMKKLTMLIMLAVICIPVFGQTENEILSKANDLIANKKYATAFRTLKDFDPKD